MSGLIGWASNILDTVKNSVVSPFVAETPTFQVKQGPTKQRPASKPGSKKKKKVQKPHQRKTNRPVSKSINSDASTDSEPEETSQHQEKPLDVREDQLGSASSDDGKDSTERDSATKGDQDGNESDEKENSIADDDDVSPAAGELSAKALKAREKSRRRQQRLKVKMKTKKALLANSLVKNLPPDELEEERRKAYTECSEKLASIQSPSGSELPSRMMLADSQRALAELIERIDELCRTIGRKTPRVDDRSLTSSSLKKLIQNMELSEDRDETALNKRVDDLVRLVSAENQKGFQRRMDLLKDAVDLKRRENLSMIQLARIQEVTERILSRLTNMPNEELKNLKESDLHNVAVELSSQMQSVIFVPFHLSRKIERRFGVVIDTQPFPPSKATSSLQGNNTRSESGRRSGPNASSKNITVWGPKDNVDKAVVFITQSDQDGTQKKTFDKTVMGNIIGKGGSGLNQIESSTNAFVIIDGLVDVMVVGPAQDKSAAWQMIDKLISNQQETLSSVNIHVNPVLARAIQTLHKARVQTLEQDIKGRIVFVLNPQEKGPPFVVVKAKADMIEQAKAKVLKELLDEFRVVELPAAGRAVTRLLSPPRSTSETSEVRLVHEEFRILRESMALFVRRSEPTTRTDSDGGASSDEDQKESSGLVIVCHHMDEDTIRTKVGALIQRASYLTERIPIEREQLRIFTPDTRALIESSSHCRFAVQSGQNDSAVLLLTGSAEALVDGKALVTEILQKKGGVVNHKLSEIDVIPILLKDKGTKIRALQYTHNVSISIDRKTATAKIVGDDQSTEEAAAALEELCAEIREHKANLETLQIEIDSSAVAQIIGRGGSTINDIRQSSGADSIDIPRQTGNKNPITVLTIVGTKEAVAIAEKMIQRIAGHNNRPTNGQIGEGSELPSHTDGGYHGIDESGDPSGQSYTTDQSAAVPVPQSRRGNYQLYNTNNSASYTSPDKRVSGNPANPDTIDSAQSAFSKRFLQPDEQEIDESNFPSIESTKRL